jgi:hypothetical protein
LSFDAKQIIYPRTLIPVEIAIIAGIYVSSMLVYLQPSSDGLKLSSNGGGVSFLRLIITSVISVQ